MLLRIIIPILITRSSIYITKIIIILLLPMVTLITVNCMGKFDFFKWPSTSKLASQYDLHSTHAVDKVRATSNCELISSV